jgi:hypothetical protein
VFRNKNTIFGAMKSENVYVRRTGKDETEDDTGLFKDTVTASAEAPAESFTAYY